MNAIHSSAAAAAAQPDEAGGLDPILFLANGAKVMLTANLWPEVGLCNGASGTVVSILFTEDQRSPCLPIAVIVRFDVYTGPSLMHDQPCCVPIPPITFEWTNVQAKHSRQQLPLQLRYAITIPKCQGQTLNKAVIDLGKKEMAAGCTFVAISRLRSLEDSLIEPMSYQRLLSISKGKNFQSRVTEEVHLEQLAVATQQNNAFHLV